jgi:hypothetical protein
MDKQVALDFIKAKKERYVKEHRIVLATTKNCRGLTQKEFEKVAIHGRRTYKKKHVQNAYWRNSRERIDLKDERLKRYIFQ